MPLCLCAIFREAISDILSQNEVDSLLQGLSAGKIETETDVASEPGDISTYEGKLKLIATATAEAAVAVNFAKNYIDPAAKVSPGHSSDRDKKRKGSIH